MKVSDLFVKCLETEGVRYVFGVPGEENQDLLFSLRDSSIEFIPTRHENGAAFMADVWGRLSGEAGVCLATLGPGATNLLTGVADAYSDKAPLIAITGQGSVERMHHESHQYIDVMALYRPITKYSATIRTPSIVTEVIRKAFKEATIEKPGATHIELPEDIAKLDEPSQVVPLIPLKIRRAAADYKAISKTMELINSARKPLILAGNGAVRKLASKHLTQLAETHNIPVVATFMGKGSLSDKSDQSLLAVGLGMRDYVLGAIDEADLVITVGYDIGEYSPDKWNPSGDKKIIHIDFVSADSYTNYQPEVEVICDISDALWQINLKLQENSVDFDGQWYTKYRQLILDDITSYDLADDQALTTPGCLNIIRKQLADDGLLISDVGSHKMWIARNFPTYVPNGTIIGNGFCSMGIALPGGIAARLYEPNRQIIAAQGDGGFMMNSQELETAKRIGANYINIVFNDNDYGLIRWKQQMNTGGQDVSTGLSNPDFKAYAESFGITGYSCATAEEFRQALASALTKNELCVIEAKIDPKVNLQLRDKLAKYWQDK